MSKIGVRPLAGCVLRQIRAQLPLTALQACKNESRARHAQMAAAGVSGVGRGRSGVKRSASVEAPLAEAHHVLDMHLQVVDVEASYAAAMAAHHAGERSTRVEC